jgi:pyruvate/2-oxoglutarate dehydrogenase complex dihydrolipoamide acyltransferase (E2) component
MDVLMPQLGETVAEGKITKWFKSAGEPIKPGDNLFEIETDKVSMEVPSTTAGVLSEIRVSAGEVAPVGAVVAIIADGSATAASPSPAAENQQRRRPWPHAPKLRLRSLPRKRQSRVPTQWVPACAGTSGQVCLSIRSSKCARLPIISVRDG